MLLLHVKAVATVFFFRVGGVGGGGGKGGEKPAVVLSPTSLSYTFFDNPVLKQLPQVLNKEKQETPNSECRYTGKGEV